MIMAWSPQTRLRQSLAYLEPIILRDTSLSNKKSPDWWRSKPLAGFCSANRSPKRGYVQYLPLVISLSVLLVQASIRPKSVVVPGAAVPGVYKAGEMPKSVIVDFARNFVVDLANFTPASAEKGFLSAARYMSPEFLSRFEPVAGEQLKQLVGNRVSQFFTVDSHSVEGRGPFVVKFLGEKVTYVGRTETERKPYRFQLTLHTVESTHENPYGLLVTSVEQREVPKNFYPRGQS
ncbi:MAG: TraE/TraK family type IV conjugative transfer system protein [Candidatus Binatia bacterium]